MIKTPAVLALAGLAGLAGLTTLVTPAVAAEDERRPAGAAQEKAPAPYVPGELLVRFEDTGSGPARQRSMRERAVAEVGGRVAQRLDRAVPGLQRVTLQDDASVTEAIAALEARDDVAYAEPNYLLSAEAVPNDSRFPELWGLHNTGQRVKGVTGTVDADIDAPAAWDLTKGSANVTVAVLDSGIAEAHPDLAPNLWANTDEVAGNGVDDDGNGFVDDRWGWDFIEGDALPRDEQGHGTHVAGTIGAKGNNDTAGPGTTDVVGVAWNVRLMPLRVLDETGTGSYSHLIAAAAYARQNGAHIANLSLGGSWYSEALRDAFVAAPEVLWVTAAGNDGTDLEYLAHFPCEFDLPQIVCVAATDSRDRLDRFSNFGRVSVDVAAPGVSVLSTWPFSPIFRDDFETSISGRWVTGGTPDTWARTTTVPYPATGTWLTDSPDGRYPDDTDNWARTTALNLSGLRDCLVRFNSYVDTESFYDYLRLEVARSATGPWTEIGQISGIWPVPEDSLEGLFPDDFDGVSQAYVRFRMDADEIYDGDGAYVDDVTIDCAGIHTASSYQYLTGTSMAAPHVSGVAALVKARNPGFTTAQLRAKVLAGVDPKSSLTGKVATGGRINAYLAVR